jgi:hypothetical protein
VTAVQIVYWRDIPAQVKARSGRVRASQPLSDRFQEAIDAAAMQAGATQSDAYLAEWRTAEQPERDGEPEAAAAAIIAELESAYPAERLKAMVANGGTD